MPQTPFNKHTYPNENQDPFFDGIKTFFSQQDSTMFFSKLKGHMVLMGGGTITFNSGTGLLSWTSSFAVKNCISGFLVSYPNGPDGSNQEANLQEGQFLYGVIPATQSQNETRNLLVADKIDISDNFIVLATRYNGKVYFSNGQVY